MRREMPSVRQSFTPVLTHGAAHEFSNLADDLWTIRMVE
jgi:hypothetical protein